VLLAASLLPAVYLAVDKAGRRPDARAIAAAHTERWNTGLESGSVAFRDATLDWGLAADHDNDANGRFWIPEEMGPGVALLDMDGDTDLDVFVTAGGSLDGSRPARRSELWRNEQGRFVEVAQELGAAVPGPAYGVACGDVDGDGDVDLFVTRMGADVLLINEGGVFRDATEEYGLGHEGFGTSAAFFDYDQDGRLDLYLCNYLDWSPEHETECFMSGVPDYCDPTSYDASAQDRLYRNINGALFEDVTVSAGIDGHRGNGLGVVASDFDGDGWTDLYVANDSTPAMLWRNSGHGTFTEEALRSGCAYSEAGVAIAGMGIACEDLDADGVDDLVVSNIHEQSHLALLTRGERFIDSSSRLGFSQWSIPPTGFGIALLDQDHDGAWDIYVTNGGVNLTPARINDPEPYAEVDQFARLVEGRFVDKSEGAGLPEPATGRALAYGDLDGDGDLDLVITNNGGSVQVLANEHDGADDWLLIDVRTAAGAPALQARVSVTIGERELTRTVRAAASYLASHDPRVHVGLGTHRQVDALQVRWPDGTVREWKDVPGGQVLVAEPR